MKILLIILTVWLSILTYKYMEMYDGMVDMAMFDIEISNAVEKGINEQTLFLKELRNKL